MKIRKLVPYLYVIVPAVVFMLVALADDAFARAGGGGGYRSSSRGGSFGGGSSSGDGGGFLLYMLIRLVIHHPFIGIPVLIGVGVFLYYTKIKAVDSYQGHVIRNGRNVKDDNNNARALVAISEKDPGFESKEFLKRVASGFKKIQKAWCEQKLEPVRAFVSDGIFERFQLQIAEQQDLGYRDRMDDLEIKRVSIVQVETDALFDVITIKIVAASSDYRVGLKDGKPLQGSIKAKKPFVEYWSFLRKRGVQTIAGKPGLLEGNCPNCGASIALNPAAKCEYCGAILRSGEYDWVLSEITQEQAWRPVRTKQLAGVEDLQERDKGFNVQHMEDRASVMFWRKAMADRLDKISPLANISSAEFTERYSAELKRRAANPEGRKYLGECAVGSVDTLGVIPGKVCDLALVEINWSGVGFVSKNGEKPKSTKRTTVNRSLFILSRKPEAQSASDGSLSSAHCPSCGAPESGNEGVEGKCQYCGAVLNDGTQDWILEDWPAWAEPRAQKLLREMYGQTAPAPVRDAAKEAKGEMTMGGVGCVGWIVKTMLADGQIDMKEKEMLKTVAAKHHVPEDILKQIIEAGQAGTLDVPEPRTPAEGKAWVTTMADMALADGAISAEELELLNQLGAKVGLSPWDVKLIAKQEKAQLYRKARDELKTAKMRKVDFGAWQKQLKMRSTSFDS